MRDMKWLLSLLAAHWPRVALALVLGFLTITSHIGLMATSAYLLARAALQPPILDLMVTIVGVRFFGISRAVFRYLERYVAHDLTFRLLSRLRVSVFRGLEPLGPAGLQKHRSGDLLGRIVGDVETLQNLFLKVLAPPLVAALVLLGYGGFVAGFDQRLPYLLAGFFLLAGAAVPYMVLRMSKGVGQKRLEGKARLNILVLDVLKGMPEILIFGQSKNSLQKLHQVQTEIGEAERRQAWITGGGNALTSLLMNLAMLTFLVIGVTLVEEGALNGVYLGMLALGTLSSFEAVFPLTASFQLVEESRVAAHRLGAIVLPEERGVGGESAESSAANERRKRDAEKTGKSGGGYGRVEGTPLTLEKYTIEFNQVSFRYEPEEEPALKNLSLKIPHGGWVAIVGSSGAGKTSLVNLLLRFWEPETGEIRIGGVNIRDLGAEEVRSLIGVVTQRTHLFNTTIRENLLLANPQASDQEIRAVADRAKLHDFILSLPDGYDSYVGEGGMKLSGGQQQRLAIARVLLKNAPILILDEATSGLDPVTEQAVIRELKELCREKTTLLITHRLEIAKEVGQILVVDGGKIAEQGTHEELLQRKGVYQQLWTSRDRELSPEDENILA